MIYGETGEYPLTLIDKKRIIGYYAKLSDNENPTLAKKMYNVCLHMHETTFYCANWLKCTRQILRETQKAFLLENIIIAPKKALIRTTFSHSKVNL